jgi:hypothetical protein
MRRLIAAVVAAALLVPSVTAAQVPGEVWRTFAASLDLGTELNVRLTNGQRFRAILVGATDEGVLLQPKTREAVPVQRVSYEAIASLERRTEGGVGPAKAAAIGVGSGVGVFFGLLLILFAAVGD